MADSPTRLALTTHGPKPVAEVGRSALRIHNGEYVEATEHDHEVMTWMGHYRHACKERDALKVENDRLLSEVTRLRRIEEEHQALVAGLQGLLTLSAHKEGH